jgi:hypothetical protein
VLNCISLIERIRRTDPAGMISIQGKAERGIEHPNYGTRGHEKRRSAKITSVGEWSPSRTFGAPEIARVTDVTENQAVPDSSGCGVLAPWLWPANPFRIGSMMDMAVAPLIA